MWTTGVAIAIYRRMPIGLRGALIRTVAPTYAVGTLVLLTRPDGRILLVRQTYRDDWFLPGGLLARRETPAEAGAREVREEVGLDVVVGAPEHVFIDPPIRAVTAFCPAAVDEAMADTATATSREILRVEWFDPLQLPPINDELERALHGLHLFGR